jgi:hypothetical protein
MFQHTMSGVCGFLLPPERTLQTRETQAEAPEMKYPAQRFYLQMHCWLMMSVLPWRCAFASAL